MHEAAIDRLRVYRLWTVRPLECKLGAERKGVSANELHVSIGEGTERIVELQTIRNNAIIYHSSGIDIRTDRPLSVPC